MTRDTTFEEDDWRSRASAYTGGKLEQNLAVVAELADFAQQRGLHVSQLAIAWALAKPGVHVAIVGARSRGQHRAKSGRRRRRAQRRRYGRNRTHRRPGRPGRGASPEGVV